jgi:hypothetical protein
MWGVDNAGNILLNGVDTGVNLSSANASNIGLNFRQLNPFTITLRSSPAQTRFVLTCSTIRMET